MAHARLYRAVAAAVERHGAARSLNTALRRDIDDARGAQPEFCRQRAGDQAHGRDEARIQSLAEYADPFRQNDAIDPILQAVVLAADMKLTEGILRNLGHLQDDLVEQRVISRGHLCNGRSIDGIGVRAGLGLYLSTAV